jgi:hypothetical protein
MLLVEQARQAKAIQEAALRSLVLAVVEAVLAVLARMLQLGQALADQDYRGHIQVTYMRAAARKLG